MEVFPSSQGNYPAPKKQTHSQQRAQQQSPPPVRGLDMLQSNLIEISTQYPRKNSTQIPQKKELPLPRSLLHSRSAVEVTMIYSLFYTIMGKQYSIVGGASQSFYSIQRFSMPIQSRRGLSFISQQLPEMRSYLRFLKNSFSKSLNESTQNKTPTVLSKILVIKYHKQVSEVGSSVVRATEMDKLIKWANSCEIPCLAVSNLQIFHGRRGCSKNLFRISTENDNTPRQTWIRMPFSPTIEQ